MTFRRLIPFLALAVVISLSSCSKTPPPPPTPNPTQTMIQKAVVVNPFPVGSYEHFKFAKYPGTTKAWKNEALLAAASPANTSVVIDLSDQRGFLLVNGEVAMDYRVSTGRSTHKTPTGNFHITEKLKDKRSNLYGKILDADGKVVKSKADAREDEIPEGGSFLGAGMPHWMRLTNDGVGMHKGNVNRRYASHGCIRTHYAAVPIVFSKVKVGTPVVITE